MGARVVEQNPARSAARHLFLSSSTTFPSYSSKAAKVDAEGVMPRNSLKDVYSATYQKDTGKIYDKKPFKMRFNVTEDKEYWLCNCKQTSNRPFCDGTHKREDIQAAVK
uniref:Iron-binding zinc finger CDGSH type domain-containing protein n=1 Tax=Timema genevievae TaxID=629358 RepID=A0A7R9K502_TIMGE|nr:unnamed protein product [Timema genevievae]